MVRESRIGYAIVVLVLAIMVWGFFRPPEKPKQRFLFPPTCHPVAEEQAVVCMSWDALNGEFVEVNRFPFPEVSSERGS